MTLDQLDLERMADWSAAAKKGRTRMHIFDGETIDPAKDTKRLSSQFERVIALMRDSKWRTLAEIAEAVGGSEAGVSARLRDCRKPRFGAYHVGRERLGNGLYHYNLRDKE